MPVSPARAIAYRVLRRVQSGRGFAADLLQGREISELKEADRRLVTELVMGVLRWARELEIEIGRVSGKPFKSFDPEVATILCLGIYQIRFLTKIPKSAVVNEAVEMTKAARKRSAAGLINAVLRKCAPPARSIALERFGKPGLESLEMACRTLPEWLLERWKNSFGVEAARALAWQSTLPPPVTLRVRGGEAHGEAIQSELAQEGIQTRAGRFRPAALVVASGSIRATTALREGRIVIQDEASQLVAELVQPEAGHSVLDLCAAPGIKTGRLAEALGEGKLVAADISARRLRMMAGLLPKPLPQGLRLARVRLDATEELPFSLEFDRILLDVPCSGTGTLARNPEIKARLQPIDVARLAETQRIMLRNALPAVAPGGRLVYATCSLEPEENEQAVHEVLQKSPRFRLLSALELAQEFPAMSSLFDSEGYFRTRPDLHAVDGFFAAVIVRMR